jgi:hypothetical protein
MAADESRRYREASIFVVIVFEEVPLGRLAPPVSTGSM